jgi:putative hydrolase of the HAD superfamily
VSALPGEIQRGCVLFDWGDTLMRDFPEYRGPMAGWPAVELMPHAAEALSDLKSAGWSTALATNAQDSSESQIREALERGGISHLIDRVYCLGNTGAAKPDVLFFEHILNDLGLVPERLIMVGDDYGKDVRGALDAGLRAVWLREPASSSFVEGCAMLPDLGGLVALLAAWDG